MKNVGIQWIDPIPNHWEVRKIGQMYKERRTKVSDIDYPPLSVTMKGIVPQLATAAKTDAHDDRKLVKKGDFAINSRSDRRGSCGIAQQDGSVSLINTVLCPKKETNPEYLNWLFHTSLFADEFYRWGHGIVDDLWTTNWSDMKRIVIPFPSLPEQSRIATFLDKRCGKIDEAIAKHKALIEKLDEYRKAVITKAVTKGVRGEREMKESGVDWIKLIPSEWEIKRLKFSVNSFNKGNGITKEEVFEDGNTPCIRYGEIYSKYTEQVESCISATNIEIQSSPKYVFYGDILAAGTGELIEEIGKNIVYLGTQSCLAGGDIIIIKHQQNPVFLNYALNSAYVQVQKSYGKAKLKVVHISASEIANLMVAIPSPDEQSEIASFLDKKCAAIDAAKERHTQLIAKLEEYKKSLIYNAVTGKIEC